MPMLSRTLNHRANLQNPSISISSYYNVNFTDFKA